jgi:prepilin-type N-terminal cleavage/methylation domain-containing protein
MTTDRRARRGFTLVEMLLASTLAAVLMGGVLAATAGLSRDRRRMEERVERTHSSAATDVIRRDLTNAAALVAAGPRGFELVCHGGIDGKTLAANQRLVRVTYRVVKHRRGAGSTLVREQAYLDDPIRRDRWSEVVATGVTGITLTAQSGDAEPVEVGEDVSERLRAISGAGGDGPIRAVRVASRVRVRIEFGESVVERDMVLR